MPDPLSLQTRTTRIACRLQALQQFIDWASARAEDEPPVAAFWDGLSTMLGDIAADAERLRRMPFPLSEWQGQTWEAFRDEYEDHSRS